MTLRLRLSLMLTLVTLGGLLFFGSLAYVLFVQQQMRQLEGLLARDLTRVQSLLQRPEVGERLVDTEQGDFVLQFVSREGQVVLPLTADSTLPLHTEPTVDRFGERSLLVSSLPWVSVTGVERGTIRLALDLRDALAARRNLLRSLLLSGALIALLAVAVGVWLLRRSLAPLVSLAVRARTVDPAHPRSVPHKGPPDEVADMAYALNIALEGIRQRQEGRKGLAGRNRARTSGPFDAGSRAFGVSRGAWRRGQSSSGCKRCRRRASLHLSRPAHAGPRRTGSAARVADLRPRRSGKTHCRRVSGGASRAPRPRRDGRQPAASGAVGP